MQIYVQLTPVAVKSCPQMQHKQLIMVLAADLHTFFLKMLQLALLTLKITVGYLVDVFLGYGYVFLALFPGSHAQEREH